MPLDNDGYYLVADPNKPAGGTMLQRLWELGAAPEPRQKPEGEVTTIQRLVTAFERQNAGLVRVGEDGQPIASEGVLMGGLRRVSVGFVDDIRRELFGSPAENSARVKRGMELRRVGEDGRHEAEEVVAKERAQARVLDRYGKRVRKREVRQAFTDGRHKAHVEGAGTRGYVKGAVDNVNAATREAQRKAAAEQAGRVAANVGRAAGQTAVRVGVRVARGVGRLAGVLAGVAKDGWLRVEARRQDKKRGSQEVI